MENARRIGVLLPYDLTATQWTTAGAGASSAFSGDDNERVTLTNTSGSSATLVASIDVTAGKYYSFSIRQVTVPAAYGPTVGILFNGTAPTSGDALKVVDETTDGSIINIEFLASTTESTTITFGVAAGDAEDSGVVFEKFSGYEYDEATSNIVDKTYNTADINENRFPFNFFTKMNAASTVSSNVVTEVTPTDERDLWPGALVHFIGDSQNAGSQGAVPTPGDYVFPEYSEYIRLLSNRNEWKMGVFNDHIAGSELATIETNIPSYRAGGRWPASMIADGLWTPPPIVVFNGSGNDIVNGSVTTVAELQTIFDGCVSALRANSAQYIIYCNNTPVETATAGQKTLINDWNTALEYTSGGIQVVPFYSLTVGNVNTDALSDTRVGSPDTYEVVEGTGADFQRNITTDKIHFSDQCASYIAVHIYGAIMNIFNRTSISGQLISSVIN